MRCLLIVEEFSPNLIYTKGSENIVVDTVSCIDKIDYLKNNNHSNGDNAEPTLESLHEYLTLNDDDLLHPTSFKSIMRFQQKDKSLIQIPKENPKE